MISDYALIFPFTSTHVYSVMIFFNKTTKEDQTSDIKIKALFDNFHEHILPFVNNYLPINNQTIEFSLLQKMTSHSYFFSDPTLQLISLIKLSGEVLLDGLFNLHQHQNSDLKLILLVGNYLIQYDNHTRTHIRKIAQLTFETRFLMLTDDNSGRLIGIKFDKDGHQPDYIYSNSQQLLRQWRNNLEKRINQRGFHQLFKPIKKIGKGNFASVYLAERKEDSRMVAVKAFSKQITFSQEKGKESLMNEIKLLRQLNNQNILKLYSVYESQNSIYMTLELLQGGQLYEKIQSKYKFTPLQVKELMKSLIQGLEHMYSHRIMHRDLKPQNIMLRTKDSLDLVIADFGLATWADEPDYLFVRCGTPGYVAPEIINLKNLKTKSEPICDMFSAGLIFHILIFGKSIFPGKTYNDVLAQNRACSFNLDSPQYCQLPQETHNLLKRMLDKNPETRIRPEEALNHSYFRSMQTQEPVLLQMKMNYPNTPLVHKSLIDKSNFHMNGLQSPQLKYKPSFVSKPFQQNKENQVSRVSSYRSKSRNKQN